MSVFDAALAALDAMQAASDEEDRRFAAYVAGERHPNAVRAAERKHNDAQYIAIDAVSAAAKLDPRIADVWGSDVLDPAVRSAIKRARKEHTA